MNHATIHPVCVRAIHRINAAAVILICMIGWRMYEASPIFAGYAFRRQSRSAAGWAAHCSGTSRSCGYWLPTSSLTWRSAPSPGNGAERFLPITVRAIATDLVAALRGKLSHSDLGAYSRNDQACSVIRQETLRASGRFPAPVE
ncbi:hypothetical protein [Paraburkholderia sartisoli]|uniref:hypothetical protein n=1 Tax=Paraburkholderia sartisoli TaxID=83784 RepID=UPI002ADE5666|nr:hypothetical protein [Paraburkholderia sartisoli]